MALIASLFTINPIWNYGPYDPSPVSAGTQPDWYIGFADGALRLIPPGWEFVWLDRTWSFNILVPLIAIGIFILLVVAYPFIEAWVKGDKREHHIADRPRNAPTRTAIGAAGVTFYAGLWAAASSDILATHFSLTMEGVIHALQAMVVLGPFVAYFIAKRVCIALQKKDREIVLHGYESGRIVKLPGGEFIEVHQPLDEYDRWRLVSFETYEPLMIRPNSRGKITVGQRMRAGHVPVVLRGPHRAGHQGRARGVALQPPLSRPLSDSGTGPMSIDTTWLRCPNCLLDLSAIDDRVFGCPTGTASTAPGRATSRCCRRARRARSATIARCWRLVPRCSTVAPTPPSPRPSPRSQPRSQRWRRGTARIADLGCGTGYYSAAVARALPAADVPPRRPVARRCPHQPPRAPPATGVVLDLWRPLPIRDDTVDVALNVFAPRNGGEFARVLRPDGRLVVVVPPKRTCRSSDGPAQSSTSLRARPTGRTAARRVGLPRRGDDSIEYSIETDATTRGLLAGMGPSAHHVGSLSSEAARCAGRRHDRRRRAGVRRSPRP